MEGGGGGGQRSTGVVVLCKPPPSLHPACLSYCLTASFYPHAAERKGEKRGRGKKQHLIRSSYSTSFKGTLNDVFLGRRQLHITSHAQGTTESWRRACGCTGCGYSCARDGLVSPLGGGGRREARSPRWSLPFTFLLWWRVQRREGGGRATTSEFGREVGAGEGVGRLQEERESLP